MKAPSRPREEASFRRLTELDQLVFDRLGYPDLPESFFRDVDRAFRQRSAFHVFPDVIPALDAMQAAGLRLGVVSNWGWYAPELLQTLELARHFEVLSISARVGYQKPHPAIFEHALELLGVGPDAGIHVGDDPEADVMGAESRGYRADPHRSADRRHPPVGSDAPVDGVAHIRDFGELLDCSTSSVRRPCGTTAPEPDHDLPSPAPLRRASCAASVREQPPMVAATVSARPSRRSLDAAGVVAPDPAVPGLRPARTCPRVG